jgi:hypothetical protein
MNVFWPLPISRPLSPWTQTRARYYCAIDQLVATKPRYRFTPIQKVLATELRLALPFRNSTAPLRTWSMPYLEPWEYELTRLALAHVAASLAKPAIARPTWLQLPAAPLWAS